MNNDEHEQIGTGMREWSIGRSCQWEGGKTAEAEEKEGNGEGNRQKKGRKVHGIPKSTHYSYSSHAVLGHAVLQFEVQIISKIKG